MALAYKTTTIDDLCDDLLCVIFDRLPVKTVIGIKRVNKAFLRSAQTWFKTVDKMLVIKGRILLSKSTGRRSEWPVDYFYTGSRRTFSRFDRLLDSFTEIKNFSINCSTGIDGRQLVHLVSRCPNINQFSLNFYEVPFNDEDWISLVELIKDYQIRLIVQSSFSYRQGSSLPILAIHLEQLFASAKNVKAVIFNRTGVEPLMAIALLNESADVRFEYCNYGRDLNDGEKHRLADLVSKHVNVLRVDMQNFKTLPARRFSKLSHLEIDYCSGQYDYLIPAGFEFPHLKRLIINDGRGHIIASFFVNVPKMELLETLEIRSGNLLVEDDQLNAMLEKAANVSQLKIHVSYVTRLQPATVPVLVKLFQLLSAQKLTRLRNVSVRISLELVSADQFKLIIEKLSAFTERSEAELKLYFSGDNTQSEKQSCFKEMTENMSNNVEIKW